MVALSDITTKVDKVSEVYFIGEVAKFLSINYNEVLDCSGVEFAPELFVCKLWDSIRIAYKQRYIINIDVPYEYLELDMQSPLIVTKKTFVNVAYTLDKVEPDEEDMQRRKEDKEYNIIIPQYKQVIFEHMDDDYWSWSLKGNTKDMAVYNANNTAINCVENKYLYQSWCSFLAWVTVEHIMNGTPKLFFLLIDRYTLLSYSALDYVLSVTEHFSDFFDSWFEIKFDADNVFEHERLEYMYSSWYREGIDLGLTQELKDIHEKRAYMKKLDMQVGDVVFLYERKKTKEDNKKKKITACNMGVITSISESTVQLFMVYNHKTLEHCQSEWDNTTMAVKDLYDYKMPFSKLVSRVENLSFYNIGIGNMLHNEHYFIVPISEAYDEVRQVILYNGRRVTVYMSQNDLIYWILKEHNVKFNEKRFLDKYFKTDTPIWTKVQNGEDISAYANASVKNYYFERSSK